ncbi:unnamed protein product [Closterium sp. Naga37s-1]|nr:unnamed protein product [Closterium sp. Naga37s-1]
MSVIGLNFDFLVFSLTKHTAVIGLNFDFLVFNLTKHTAYLIFNASVFFSPLVQQQYHAKYGAEELIPVSASDVAFSVHAVALTAFTVWQCMVYNRGGQRVSWTCKAISLGVWIFALLTSLHSSFHHDWLGLVTTFNYIQVVMTTIKYIPQAWFNWQRRSTVGWSISNVLMDLTGGTASLLMMFVQSIDQSSFVNFTGNVGKLALSGETIAFDIIFAVQHYVLFPHAPLPLSTTSALSAHPSTLVSTLRDEEEGEKEGKGKGEEEQPPADEFTRLLPSRRSGGLF